jgi:transcriptional antiterminator RfaH
MIGARWYCLHTQPGLEKWARTNLWEMGLEVYLPQYVRIVRHARKVAPVARPLFPRYLFARADLTRTPARWIRSARGVSDIVSMGQEPVPVADAVVAEIRGREDTDGYVHLGGGEFQAGESVKIVATSLCDQVGLFECATDQERVVVLLQILGRNVRVRVDRRDIVRTT